MEPVAIVTSVMLLQYYVFGALVGRARGRFGIKAPATTGHPDFERCFRAHQNELEQLAITVPSMWLFGAYIHALAAAGIGLLYVVGRSLYFRGYVAEASGRGRGFMVGMLATTVLLFGGLIGAVISWL
ncbi:MAG: MAPEG family protein [Gammaproteobacteria bacterium]|nr:MAPEG family protein [Gammaproteobacteria bacterium]